MEVEVVGWVWQDAADKRRSRKESLVGVGGQTKTCQTNRWEEVGRRRAGGEKPGLRCSQVKQRGVNQEVAAGRACLGGGGGGVGGGVGGSFNQPPVQRCGVCAAEV